MHQRPEMPPGPLARGRGTSAPVPGARPPAATGALTSGSRLRAAWAVRLLGVTAILLGGGYFIAWMAGLAPRWSSAGVITMKTNMALSLVLAGAALVLSQAEPTRARELGRILAAAFVLAAGLLTLSEHLFHVDLRIDQLLAAEPPGSAATASPNRFGIPGAVSLTLLGAGLLALRTRRAIASSLGLATLMITAIPAVGWLYRVGLLYRQPTTGIAWTTVIALSAIAVGLMLSPPRQGPVPLPWRDDPGGLLVRRAWMPAVLFPVLVGALRAEGERRGLYDGSVGDGAATIVLVVFFTALILRSASRLSGAAEGQRRAEEALRDALAQATSLGRFPQENPDPVLRLSADLTVLYANKAALSCFGALGVTEGRTAPQPFVAAAERALATGQRTALELASGAAVFSMTIVPVGDEVNLYGQDVTARKHAEEALREEGRRKSEFLGMLSHELRNPLAPIRTSVYLLRRLQPGSEQATRAQAVIERQTEHLTRLVDDLLDVTRIERGKIELRRTRVDLRELIASAADDYRPLLQERGIHFRVAVSATSTWADVDPTRITQIIGNLIHNASKFTGPGGEIALSLSSEGEAAEIRVADSGDGVEPALLATLFEPFVQGERTLARSQGGLGLGLALVKGLTELHGGTVRAESAGKGRGAAFTVRLPTATGSREHAGAAAARGPGGTRTVLVVDDNADAADALAEVVRRLGHSARVAYDGPAALAAVREHLPDVVVCDLGLPGMDGYEVARQLRRMHDGDIRLIALSGYAQPDDVSRALAAGFDAHVAKPPDLDRLAEVLVASRPERQPA